MRELTPALLDTQIAATYDLSAYVASLLMLSMLLPLLSQRDRDSVCSVRSEQAKH